MTPETDYKTIQEAHWGNNCFRFFHSLPVAGVNAQSPGEVLIPIADAAASFLGDFSVHGFLACPQV